MACDISLSASIRRKTSDVCRAYEARLSGIEGQFDGIKMVGSLCELETLNLPKFTYFVTSSWDTSTVITLDNRESVVWCVLTLSFRLNRLRTLFIGCSRFRRDLPLNGVIPVAGTNHFVGDKHLGFLCTSKLKTK